MANICFIKSKSVCCGSTCFYQALIWSFISELTNETASEDLLKGNLGLRSTCQSSATHKQKQKTFLKVSVTSLYSFANISKTWIGLDCVFKGTLDRVILSIFLSEFFYHVLAFESFETFWNLFFFQKLSGVSHALHFEDIFNSFNHFWRLLICSVQTKTY